MIKPTKNNVLRVALALLIAAAVSIFTVLYIIRLRRPLDSDLAVFLDCWKWLSACVVLAVSGIAAEAFRSEKKEN